MHDISFKNLFLDWTEEICIFVTKSDLLQYFNIGDVTGVVI